MAFRQFFRQLQLSGGLDLQGPAGIIFVKKLVKKQVSMPDSTCVQFINLADRAAGIYDGVPAFVIILQRDFWTGMSQHLLNKLNIMGFCLDIRCNRRSKPAWRDTRFETELLLDMPANRAKPRVADCLLSTDHEIFWFTFFR